ncbi:FAD-binding oxidoreductase [Variovorax guangxiensis]|uniref:NAD(P)/FAD-dependent oxidoreductase n=1 Tax=Variovorax guangxiensis TaxID=1775474 RepID=UPI00286C6A5F|nr:FAD-binding oxidoreductase [Variovorax guangxiensis]
MAQKHKEVLVLGAGIVGVSTALALQLRGHAVTLVDRKMPGLETSYGNAGIIQREAVQPYAFPRDIGTLLRVATGRSNDAHYHLDALWQVWPRLFAYWRSSAPSSYAEIVPAYSRLIEKCIDEHAFWIEQAGAGELIHKEGWRQIYRSREAFDAAASEATAAAREHGLGCSVLGSDELASAEPGLQRALAGAIHWTDPWSVRDPGDLVARYAKLFIRRGGRFALGDAMTLRQQGAGWSVDAEGGSVQAEEAVVALGPWADALLRPLGYRLPLFIKRGYHRHYEGHAGLRLPMLDVERGVMLAPMSRGLRLTTGAEFARQDAASTPVQLGRAEQSTRELVPLGKPVEASPWLGSRPCTVDMKPVLGAAPRHKGLWFNFGHAHQGFTLGPVTGRLLAELISGEPAFIDPAPYLASRFG